MPKRLQKEEASATETYAKFIADPFETGYGHTVGNSLRRVLLSSLEGAAITSLKVDGAMHEFATIEGVTEDVTDIVLNLKKIKFKAHTRDEQVLLLSVNKEGAVTAADIQLNQNVELVNPDQHICTLDKKKKFEMELTVKIGRGFCPSDENKKPGQAIGIVAIDSIFSPVTRVRYAVEAARVGNRTDYDRLVLEIWTDGRITPDDALTQASAILAHHLDVFVGYDKNAVEFEEAADKQDDEKAKLKKLLNMSVNEIELSVRAANCLNNANITTVGQLALKTEQEMLKYRNFGKKSLNEIKEKLHVAQPLARHEFRAGPGGGAEGRSPENGIRICHETFEAHGQTGPHLGASQRDARQSGLQPDRTQARDDDPGQGQGRPFRRRKDGHARQERHHPSPPPRRRAAAPGRRRARSCSRKSRPRSRIAAAATPASSSSNSARAMPPSARSWNGWTPSSPPRRPRRRKPLPPPKPSRRKRSKFFQTRQARSLERAFLLGGLQRNQKNSNNTDEQQRRHPPDPLDAAGFEAARAELLLHEFLVIEILLGNAQMVGVGGIRPACFFIRAAFRAGFGPARHDGADSWDRPPASFQPPTPAYSSSVRRSRPIRM